jgi:hypothetical protein
VFLAAMGVAALASPVMAQTRPNTNLPLSENNVFWGLESAPLHEHAYGSVPREGQLQASTPDAAAVPPPHIIDCVHVPFPQCGGE